MNAVSKIIAVASIYAIISTGCKKEQPSSTSPEPHYHEMAAELLSRGAKSDDYIAMQLKAVEQVRNGVSHENPVEVLSQMGYLYNRTGDYRSGIEYLQEACDSSNAINGGRLHKSDIKLRGNLANFYTRFNMFPEALETNSSAISASRQNGNLHICDLYCMRAVIYDQKKMTDSVKLMLDIAYSLADTDPSSTPDRLRDNASSQWAKYLMENPELFPDSTLSAMLTLKHVIDRKYTTQQSAKFLYARGMALTGRKREGTAIMKQLTDSSRLSGFFEMEVWMTKWLARTYAETGMDKELAEIFPRYMKLTDSLGREDNKAAVISAQLRYRASEKEKELQWLNMKVGLHRKINIMLCIIIVFIITASVFFGRSIMKRFRRHRAKRIELSNKISQLLLTQKKLDSRIETLVSELNTETGKAAASFLSPQLLTTNASGKFHRAFEAVYPDFIEQLRAEYPSLTPADEELCMLIALQMSADEIASCLGITRASVISARYRVRSRLNLPHGLSLDAFIASRLVPADRSPGQ